MQMICLRYHWQEQCTISFQHYVGRTLRCPRWDDRAATPPARGRFCLGQDGAALAPAARTVRQGAPAARRPARRPTLTGSAAWGSAASLRPRAGTQLVRQRESERDRPLSAAATRRWPSSVLGPRKKIRKEDGPNGSEKKKVGSCGPRKVPGAASMVSRLSAVLFH
jgi:hypothetical protein